MSTEKKDLTYYLNLPYPSELTPCEGGGYFARHPDLDGCATQGEDVDETLANLRTAREMWLQAQLEDGAKVAEPPPPEPSGRLMLRVPLRLHAELERHAAAAGLSLNRLLNEILFNHANGLPHGYGLELPVPENGRHSPAAYPYLLTPADDGGYSAEHPDLPGCAAAGDSAVEAMAELDVARELWIAARLEDRLPVPAPLPPEHSGIINLRMPKALHFLLAREATRNGVSLNQWLNMALAEFVGMARSATRGDVHSSTEPLRQVIHRAVPRLRWTLDRPSGESLEGLPLSYTDFLRGLLHLEMGSFQEAFACFSAADAAGLDFPTEGVRIYRAVPDRLPHRQLLDLLMQLSQAIPADSPERTAVHALLSDWLEGVRERPISSEQWLRWGRDKRKRAERAARK
jgi:antitoxin HicB